MPGPWTSPGLALDNIIHKVKVSEWVCCKRHQFVGHVCIHYFAARPYSNGSFGSHDPYQPSDLRSGFLGRLGQVLTGQSLFEPMSCSSISNTASIPKAVKNKLLSCHVVHWASLPSPSAPLSYSPASATTKISLCQWNHFFMRLPNVANITGSTLATGCGLWNMILPRPLLNVTAEPLL
jgi:hypothetical protein